MSLDSHDAGTLLVFAEGGALCALPSSAIQEVVFLPELSRPPGMPGLLEGVMTLDGKAIPVLKVATLLDLPVATGGIYTPAMVLKEGRAALAVERMVDVLRPKSSDLVPAGEGQSFNGCVTGLVQIKEGQVHILSAERLLLAEEQKRIADFQAQAQARLEGKDDEPS